MTDRRIPCVIMRGGSSKAIVFAAAELPAAQRDVDELVLGAFGSPDARQVDGLGGADPLTSKLAIVAVPQDDDADVVYTFGQVGIAEPAINYGVGCGNTAAAVAVYAVQEGFVAAQPEKTEVRIFCSNNKRHIVAEVLTEHRRTAASENTRTGGVPGTGAEVRLKFLRPAGGVTGHLLPTGVAVNTTSLPGGKAVRFSMVDCGNLFAIIPAEELLLSGNESPHEIDAMIEVTAQVELLRTAISEEFLHEAIPGVGSQARAARLKIAIVARAENAAGESADVVARIINQERVHKAFAVTGAVCFAAAASIPGTVVNTLCTDRDFGDAVVRIGHPQGIIEAVIESRRRENSTIVKSVQISRTARRIMDGHVYIPEKKFL